MSSLSETPHSASLLRRVLRHMGRPSTLPGLVWKNVRHLIAPPRRAAHYDYTTWNRLGRTLVHSGRFEEALGCYREALALKPDSAAILNNLGNALCYLNRLDEAEACLREALRLEADHPNFHANLGHVLLQAGRLQEGWNEQEWRWRTTRMAAEVERISGPVWNGEELDDRVILLHAEGGNGDTLQFCRYVPLVAARTRTVLEVQRPLVRLLSQLPRNIQTIAQGDEFPSYDLHCSLMSLPHAFNTTLATIPVATPYLNADPDETARWRDRLASIRGLRVGLCWAGGHRPWSPKQTAVDVRRSMSLETLAPLGEIPGVTFVSLQIGPQADEAAHPPAGMKLYDFTSEIRDFADTAGLVDQLDLVISVDTAVLHLAGALGKPVWLLNRFDTCWRWLQGRDDSPWYPSLRQFRQVSPGNWEHPVLRVQDALRHVVKGRSV